ncbi:hypothetical protein FRIGORI9N_430026 [Frigoribacterium sp. 9N]|nr:hypothetical protein FRIGORI9N_430026 [Frigoribacterium sp. 9N]
MPRGAARRRPLGGCAGRRSYVRSPDRAASGVVRGRDDGRLDASALRRAGPHLEPHHERGGRRQPRRARRHLQAPGNDRMGMTGLFSMRSIEPGHSGGACDPGAHQ